MSGIEPVALVGAIAAIVSAFDAAQRIIERIQERRRNRNKRPPNPGLKEALRHNKEVVINTITQYRAELGPSFDDVDSK